MGANCPACESKERHRLLALAVADGFVAFAGAEVLHFAAEPIVSKIVMDQGPAKYRHRGYRGPVRPEAQSRATGPAARSFDRIICSHVLEHVDDSKALSELRRVIRPDGYLVLMIPIVEGWPETFEDAALVSTAEREAYFGQHDHVRFYGADFVGGSSRQVSISKSIPQTRDEHRSSAFSGARRYSRPFRGERALPMRAVGVVIPYFQRERGLLRRSLESVAAQTLPADVRLEIVVVDDASPIPADEEVAGLVLPSACGLTIIRQPNSGPAAARNSALDHLFGMDVDYAAFLNSDDAWYADHLATALERVSPDTRTLW